MLVSGDLIDSAQRNELDWALTLLGGGTVVPDSGARGYSGVQAASNPDPSTTGRAWTPLVTPSDPARRSPRPLARAQGVLVAGAGNHDILVQGELAPSDETIAFAVGDRLVTAPDADLERRAERGLLDRSRVDAFLRAGVPGDALRVSPDAGRVHLSADEVLARLSSASPGSPRTREGRLDYSFAASPDLQVVVLDLVRREAGSDGVVTQSTLAFLAEALEEAGERYVIVATHQPLDATAGAEVIFALLDSDPRVMALLAGHTHRNSVEPRRSSAGGYWLVTTASIVDFPQQWRALRLVTTSGGGAALETWLVDHAGRPGDESDLAGVARDLAFLDPQGGRPARAAGPRRARNVRLHVPSRPVRPPRGHRRLPALPQPKVPASLGAGDALG